MKKIIFVSTFALLAGCQPAIINSQIRESGSDQMIRCVDLTTGNEERNNSIMQKYDGWKMVYVSEYTTGNKANSQMVMCFEKAASK